MTTNGAHLGSEKKGKQMLEELAEAGLDTINLSLDSLVSSKNEFITRRMNTT